MANKKRRFRGRYNPSSPSIARSVKSTEWAEVDSVSVIIGGIQFEHVKYPLLVDGRNLVDFERHLPSGRLAASFRIHSPDGAQVARAVRNKIEDFDPTLYSLRETQDRVTLTELATGHTVCDICFPALDPSYELDLSLTTYPRASFPIQLHPNRTKIGLCPSGQPPNFLGGTFSTPDPDAAMAAFFIKNASTYLLGSRIQSFRVGIRITTSDSPDGLTLGGLFLVSDT